MSVLAAFLAVAACGPRVGAGTDSAAVCTNGTTRCTGNQYERCVGGAWTVDAVCRGHDVCTPDSGCSGPCSPEALERTYSGCEFYAADLPQWGEPIPFGTIAAEQQFAVAVANPWDETIDVLVERNDALPGEVPIVVEVLWQEVAPRGLAVLNLEAREVSGYVNGVTRSASHLAAAAYRVTTSLPATAYQFNPLHNPGAYSNDASLLIPVSALDESYLVLGWPGMGGEVFPGLVSDNRSYITIVGSQAGTRVRVVPTTHVMAGVGLPALAPGEELVVTLGAFETLNLEGADFVTVGETDFTGTRVEADGPIALFSGTECIGIGGCCCDHMEEQLFPRSSLGTAYVAVHAQARSTGFVEDDVFRVLALADGTTVTTSLAAPNDSFTLARGAMREIRTPLDFTVTGSAPVVVGQYLLGQEMTDTGIGDPAFLLTPPIEQHRDLYIFLVPSGYAANHVMLSVPSGTTPDLDDAPPAGCTRTPVGTLNGVSYDALRCPISEGIHRLSATEPFGVQVVGVGPGPVSYGYTGGMDFNPVNQDCTVNEECGPGEFCSGGTCVPVIE